eukprot:1033869-Pelagomonas_calceolata.AAC.2
MNTCAPSAHLLIWPFRMLHHTDKKRILDIQVRIWTLRGGGSLDEVYNWLTCRQTYGAEPPLQDQLLVQTSGNESIKRGKKHKERVAAGTEGQGIMAAAHENRVNATAARKTGS